MFATLQSAGAAGYGVAAVSSAVQGVGALVAGSAGAMSILYKKKWQDGGYELVNQAEDDQSDDDDDEADSKAKLGG